MCYEDIVASLARRTTAAGAEVLISLINDSAFESDAALEQHRRLATFRAIENRRMLVRCSGTGVTCAISPSGAVVRRLPTNVDDSFVVDAPRLTEPTLFVRGGFLFPYMFRTGGLGIMLVQTRRGRLAAVAKFAAPRLAG